MLNDLSSAKNIISFADENIDHKHEFASLGDEKNLQYSINKPRIDLYFSRKHRNQ